MSFPKLRRDTTPGGTGSARSTPPPQQNTRSPNIKKDPEKGTCSSSKSPLSTTHGQATANVTQRKPSKAIGNPTRNPSSIPAGTAHRTSMPSGPTREASPGIKSHNKAPTYAAAFGTNYVNLNHSPTTVKTHVHKDVYVDKSVKTRKPSTLPSSVYANCNSLASPMNSDVVVVDYPLATRSSSAVGGTTEFSHTPVQYEPATVEEPRGYADNRTDIPNNTYTGHYSVLSNHEGEDDDNTAFAFNDNDRDSVGSQEEAVTRHCYLDMIRSRTYYLLLICAYHLCLSSGHLLIFADYDTWFLSATAQLVSMARRSKTHHSRVANLREANIRKGASKNGSQWAEIPNDGSTITEEQPLPPFVDGIIAQDKPDEVSESETSTDDTDDDSPEIIQAAANQLEIFAAVMNAYKL
ncbi:hypothetical protein JOM56_000676 [Amanita muscaria]